MSGLRHHMFNPLWRRVVLTAFLAVWTVFEFVMQNQLWGLLFAGLTVLCGYTFFVTWQDVDKPED